MTTYAPRGRYFEELTVGETLITPGRTITEADVMGFAGLSGDFSQIHTDEVYARQGVFGRRVAHGLLGLSIAVGLIARLGVFEGTILAFRELAWKFSLPIFIGDTISVTAAITRLRKVPRLGAGAVSLEVEIRNQDGQAVQRGEWLALIASRPEQG